MKRLIQRIPPLRRITNGMRNLLVRFINARFSLPTWLWAFASTAVGLIVFQYSFVKDPAIASFSESLPFGGVLWGGAVAICGVSSMYGMARFSKWPLRFGSMGSFVLWVFGAISFARAGGLANVFIFAGPMLLFWAYKYLATYVREFPRL